MRDLFFPFYSVESCESQTSRLQISESCSEVPFLPKSKECYNLVWDLSLLGVHVGEGWLNKNILCFTVCPSGLVRCHWYGRQALPPLWKEICDGSLSLSLEPVCRDKEVMPLPTHQFFNGQVLLCWSCHADPSNLHVSNTDQLSGFSCSSDIPHPHVNLALH